MAPRPADEIFRTINSRPSRIHCLAEYTALSSVRVKLHICQWGSARRSVWQMSPFPLSGGSLRGGANFCASKHWQSGAAPWWETGPRRLIDGHANMTRWRQTPHIKTSGERRRPRQAETRSDPRSKSLHIKSSSSACLLCTAWRN